MTVIGVGVALVLGGAMQAREEHEQVIPSSQVPALVQKAAEKEAKGGKLVQWEKEGNNYEAIIEKNGKDLPQISLIFTSATDVREWALLQKTT